LLDIQALLLYIPLTKKGFLSINIDDFVKSRESLENVIPAKAGIQ